MRARTAIELFLDRGAIHFLSPFRPSLTDHGGETQTRDLLDVVKWNLMVVFLVDQSVPELQKQVLHVFQSTIPHMAPNLIDSRKQHFRRRLRAYNYVCYHPTYRCSPIHTEAIQSSENAFSSLWMHNVIF